MLAIPLLKGEDQKMNIKSGNNTNLDYVQRVAPMFLTATITAQELLREAVFTTVDREGLRSIRWAVRAVSLLKVTTTLMSD
jgi:hypothetical protein